MTEERRVHDVPDFKTWLYAFLFTLVLSVAVSATRFFSDSPFNLAFEICIFYIPTGILFIIVLYLKMKQSPYQHQCRRMESFFSLEVSS